MEYDALAKIDSVNKLISNLKNRGIEGIYVENKLDALEKVKSLITAGSSLMNGSSRTLEEIGFVELLKSRTHGWNNLHDRIIEEKDPEKQALLRKQSVLSNYYIGSVHAVAETGEIVIASNSGSQLPHIVFTSEKIIFVVGTQKITPDLTTAISRLQDYVLPLEDKRMKDVGMGGSFISKLLIINREPAFMGRKVYMILVNEKLGF